MIYANQDFTTTAGPQLFLGGLVKGIVSVGRRLPVVGGAVSTVDDILGITRSGGPRQMRAQVVQRIGPGNGGAVTRSTSRTSIGPGGIFGRRTQTVEQFRGSGSIERGEFVRGEFETDAGRKSMGLDADGNQCPTCPKGMRLNKSTYFLSDGTRVAARSRCVKIRRKDALNGRAALNSTRRLASYVKANKKIDNTLKAAARRV